MKLNKPRGQKQAKAEYLVVAVSKALKGIFWPTPDLKKNMFGSFEFPGGGGG